MTLEQLRDYLRAHGGEASVWLVYQAGAFAELRDSPAVLVLQQAFFNRGQAYAFAEGRRRARMWQHYYVFRLNADLTWAEEGSVRSVQFEMAFGRERDLPAVEVTPAEVAITLEP